ncbi:MAG: c-type cytochrome [Cocleimonas sp.]|nr:c-type cytochrome [Cocleimonas sp.]
MNIIPSGIILISAIAVLSACGGGGGGGSSASLASEAILGEKLFFDKNLSKNRTQSCSTCHDPDHGFIDARLDPITNKIRAVSLGDDNVSVGSRNTPTAAYAKFSPDFHSGTRNRLNSKQPDYNGAIGGQFLDGRELDLKGQAGGPPLNPVEMNMPNKASVIDRVMENSDYIEAFERFYGDTIFEDKDKAYLKMTVSIAKFEKTKQFSPFDSKYDRSLKDATVLSLKEAFGKSLFFSQQFTNCASCHQLRPNSHAEETFSGYEYHNIGVPSVIAVADKGLFDNTEKELDIGKFKVPTLRNVAVTEPYMHNGVFQDLRTVIEFYDKFLTNSQHTINPETGQLWKDAEFPATVSLIELKDGKKMNSDRIEAMVCFLRTLTDAKYEHLIQEKGISCAD